MSQSGTIAIGTYVPTPTPTTPTPTPTPTPAHPTPHMYGGYGGMMPGFDVNHIIQMQFAGIMMKLVENMNDKSTSFLSYDKIATFLMLLLITDIKKWILDFIEFAKKFVTTNIPNWATTLWEYIKQWWYNFKWPSQQQQLQQLQQPSQNQCEQEPFYEPQSDVDVTFETNPYNMNALYQYIIMTPDERAKLGAQCPNAVTITICNALDTTIISKDNISSNIVFKSIEIAITDSLSMSLKNVGFNVNNITGTLVGINMVDLSADPMEQTLENIEENEVFKWLDFTKFNKTDVLSAFNKRKQIKIGYLAKHCWDPIYDLLHNNKDINMNRSVFPYPLSNCPALPVYALFVMYLIHTGDFDKLLKKQPVDLTKLYTSLLLMMYIAMAFYCHIIICNGCYSVYTTYSGVGYLLFNTPLTTSNNNATYNAIAKTLIISNSINNVDTYISFVYPLCSRFNAFTSDVTTTTTPATPKKTCITLSDKRPNVHTPTIYATFLEFYQKVVMKAPEVIKAAQFSANKSIVVYAISYKKTDTITMVENPEYVEWTEMMQCMGGSSGGAASPKNTADATTLTTPTNAATTATTTATAKTNKEATLDMVFVEKITPELISARIDAYKMKPPKMIKQHSSTTELVCEKVNTIYKNLTSLYLRETDKRKITSIVDKFKNRRDFYEQLGIPYKLGIMLYGHPGTGKTSTIKAVASYLEKDIYFVNLKNVRTNAELKGIFDHINEKCNGGVIVFEDMDASCDVIKRRVSNVPEHANTIVNVMDDAERGADQLTLSYLLNLFDGTICKDGTIFAITTNHLKNIDEALYRPGRVDIKIEFHKCDHYQIQQIFQHIIGRPLAANILCQIPEYTFAPAEIIFEIMHYGLDDCATDKDIMSAFIKGQ